MFRWAVLLRKAAATKATHRAAPPTATTKAAPTASTTEVLPQATRNKVMQRYRAFQASTKIQMQVQPTSPDEIKAFQRLAPEFGFTVSNVRTEGGHKTGAQQKRRSAHVILEILKPFKQRSQELREMGKPEDRISNVETILVTLLQEYKVSKMRWRDVKRSPGALSQLRKLLGSYQIQQSPLFRKKDWIEGTKQIVWSDKGFCDRSVHRTAEGCFQDSEDSSGKHSGPRRDILEVSIPRLEKSVQKMMECSQALDVDEHAEVPILGRSDFQRYPPVWRSPEQLAEMCLRRGYQQHLKKRQQLAIFRSRAEICDAVEGNDVTIVTGAPGCGKSTQVPQYIFEDSLMRGKPCKIITTQPRRISAANIAQRIADERGTTLKNGEVGYQVRFDNETNTPETSLLVCTVGILLQFLVGDQSLDNVTHVIVDEVHERSEESDTVLMVLRELLYSTRPNLKVVLMSATVSAADFQRYFEATPGSSVDQRRGEGKPESSPSSSSDDSQKTQVTAATGGSGQVEEDSKASWLAKVGVVGVTVEHNFPIADYYLEDVLEMIGKPAPSLQSPMRGFRPSGKRRFQSAGWFDDRKPAPSLQAIIAKGIEPWIAKTIDNFHQLELMENPVELIVALVKYIVANGAADPSQHAAILIFLPGLSEINSVARELLLARIPGARLRVHSLHSSVPFADQQQIFEPVKNTSEWKVIVSSNIAESSITVDDVAYVIDSGKMRINVYESNHALPALVTCPAALANVQQRRGRAGRVGPGVCLRLYSRWVKDHLPKNVRPEMQRISCETLALRVSRYASCADIKSALLRMMSPPTHSRIERGMRSLQELGILDAKHQITPLGKQIRELPLHPRLAKLLFFGALFGCLNPVVTIASSLASRSPFARSPTDEAVAEQRRRELSANCDSDHLVTHNVFEVWNALPNDAEKLLFCQTNYLDPTSMTEIAKVRQELMEMITEHGLDRHGVDSNEHQYDTRIVELVLSAGLRSGKVVRRGAVALNDVVTATLSRKSVALDRADVVRWVVFFDPFTLPTGKALIPEATPVSAIAMLITADAVEQVSETAVQINGYERHTIEFRDGSMVPLLLEFRRVARRVLFDALGQPVKRYHRVGVQEISSLVSDADAVIRRAAAEVHNEKIRRQNGSDVADKAGQEGGRGGDEAFGRSKWGRQAAPPASNPHRAEATMLAGSAAAATSARIARGGGAMHSEDATLDVSSNSDDLLTDTDGSESSVQHTLGKSLEPELSLALDESSVDQDLLGFDDDGSFDDNE